MLAKILSAAALVAAPVPVQPVYIDYPLVEKVTCLEGTGTAFVAGGRVITVAHVSKNISCEINGVQLNVAEDGRGLDFATGQSPIKGYKVNCEGFKAGEIYWAVGFARGGPERVLMYVGTGETSGGWSVLYGAPVFIPGMSGGPVFNNQGEVVGTVNAYSLYLPYSFSQELRGTSLCGAAQ